MIKLISDDFRMIQVLSRFGIHMGFGDESVKEVCEKNKVDFSTFLAIVNYTTGEVSTEEILKKISLKSLLHYLKQSHIYFLEFYLPSIRRKLLDGIKLRDSDVSFLIIKMFDEYVKEISSHMQEEEMELFPYVISILKGENFQDSRTSTYSEHHDNVTSKLKELKNIIIKYCPADADVNLLNAALYDIYRCEEELNTHCQIEDNILIPSISLNKKLRENNYGQK